MNIHLWLRCRLALVTAITAQVRGIETMKGNIYLLVFSVPDVWIISSANSGI